MIEKGILSKWVQVVLCINNVLIHRKTLPKEEIQRSHLDIGADKFFVEMHCHDVPPVTIALAYAIIITIFVVAVYNRPFWTG